MMDGGRESVDLVGSATSRLYGFLKRRPRLRGTAVAVFTSAHHAARRLLGRSTVSMGEVTQGASLDDWLEKWNATDPDAPASIIDLHGAEHIENTLAKGLHGVFDWEFMKVLDVEIPPPFVAIIPEGHVVGEHGAVVTPDGFLVERASFPVSALVEYIWRAHGRVPVPPFPTEEWDLPPRRLRGNVAVLSAYAGRAYFHWLYDVLPRLEMLRSAGVDLDEIDTFVVPSYFARFQIETLNQLGIARNRIVTSFFNRHLVADRLLVPSLTRERGVIPTWVCDFLRDAFPPLAPPQLAPAERIFMTRKETDHDLLTNEGDLARRLARHGFEALAMEEFTVSEKAWLLGNARMVVGPSGGGLANIVFCRPGTKVVELRVRPYPVMEAWDIANRVGLDFYDVLRDGYERGDRQYAPEGTLSTHAIWRTLEFAGCLS